MSRTKKLTSRLATKSLTTKIAFPKSQKCRNLGSTKVPNLPLLFRDKRSLSCPSLEPEKGGHDFWAAMTKDGPKMGTPSVAPVYPEKKQGARVAWTKSGLSCKTSSGHFDANRFADRTTRIERGSRRALVAEAPKVGLRGEGVAKQAAGAGEEVHKLSA